MGEKVRGSEQIYGRYKSCGSVENDHKSQERSKRKDDLSLGKTAGP